MDPVHFGHVNKLTNFEKVYKHLFSEEEILSYLQDGENNVYRAKVRKEKRVQKLFESQI